VTARPPAATRSARQSGSPPARARRAGAERPLYQELLVFLREQISEGRFALGNKIPTEVELCLQRGVSRTTVRLAVQQLVDEGVLERQQGRGTFVTALPSPITEQGLLNTEPKQEYHFKYIDSGFGPAPFDLATAFGLPADGEIFKLTRVQLDGRHRVAVKRYFAPAELLRGDPPSAEELKRVPFDAMLLQREVRLLRTNILAEPVLLGDIEANLLGAPAGGLSLSVQRVGFNETGRGVRVSQTVLRSDKARFFWSIRHPYGTSGGAHAPNFSVWTASAFD